MARRRRLRRRNGRSRAVPQRRSTRRGVSHCSDGAGGRRCRDLERKEPEPAKIEIRARGRELEALPACQQEQIELIGDRADRCAHASTPGLLAQATRLTPPSTYTRPPVTRLAKGVAR